MLIWLENSTEGISNSEDFHYLHWSLVADYPGHVTTYFHAQCQRPAHLKDLICGISHSMKIKYPYTKPQSPTLFITKSHTSHFCTKLWSKSLVVDMEILLPIKCIQILFSCCIHEGEVENVLANQRPGWPYLGSATTVDGRPIGITFVRQSVSQHWL